MNGAKLEFCDQMAAQPKSAYLAGTPRVELFRPTDLPGPQSEDERSRRALRGQRE